jgi:hypothetical protein
MRPLMTNSEQIIFFGPEQYSKAAAGLYMLRETVMGPELFDRSFKEYAQRWAFKHPKPADFFRTMEDASAVDLDWFWRGWFYSTDHCDQTLEQVKWFKLKKEELDPEKKNISVKQENASASADKKIENFSNGPMPFTLVATDPKFNGEFRSMANDKEIMAKLQDKNIYEVTLSNKGGLVMPVIIEWTFKDGSKQIDRIPAEVWRINESKVSKVFIKDKEVVNVVLDPQKETSDINVNDNVFPKLPEGSSKFDEFRKKAN